MEQAAPTPSKGVVDSSGMTERVRNMVLRDGDHAVSAQLGVSRLVVLRIAAGLPVRRTTRTHVSLALGAMSAA